MIDLRYRSYQKELMDGDDIPFEAMEQTLKELNVVNTRLGGHAITIQGVKKLWDGKEPITVCEIGCGGGDNLFAIYNYFQKRGLPVKLAGIDMNQSCIDFARQRYNELSCQWICSDYALVKFEEKPGIIFSSLFCHHFTDEQLVQMLQWLEQNSTKGFFINDLQRHWLAYYLIRYITKYFSRSYLVKNDACLSVARSFRKKEWENLFRLAGIEQHSITWKWAFRWLVVSANYK
ncbi:MAG TPA: methyltransferase domain-containing protein [Chitinophagaceae bacterium]|jgi:2-polyprenyl-3-methyl-5-hydroxy-6-metoxy-1,4-benzoquinol methylase|nr:methyltransferase domain-containing protein [Chitinophagaceae bacterium]